MPDPIEEMTPEQATEFEAAIAKEVDKRLEQTEGKIKEQADTIAKLTEDQASLKEQADKRAKRDGLSAKPQIEWTGEPNAKKDLTCGYGDRGLGRFAVDVFKAMTGRGSSEMLVRAAGTGVNQTIGSEGGYLVPPAFSQMIWDGLNSGTDSLLSMTDNYTVDGESLTFNANAETSRAAGSRYGGVRGYWLAELAQMTESQPKWRQAKIEPKELGVFIYVSDKMMRNADMALTQYLTRAATDEINFCVGDAIINGDGAGKPLGILSADCTIEIDAETGQAATTIVTENIVNMWKRLHARRRANAVWLINQSIEPQLYTMTLGSGSSAVPIYMPPGGLSQAPYGAILGRPVMPIEYCQALGTAGDIILADMKGYLSGTKGGIRSDMSIHLKFDYNQSCFRFLFEVDGQPWLASALTPYKGGSGNTLSTFVTIATRS